MESLQEEIVAVLKERHETVTFAESCTGGMLASSVVEVAGASWVFNESYVTYANSAKHKLLGVTDEVLSTVGPVSPECAEQMALGAQRAAGADYAVSVTGLAGPDGGTKEKPVGLVYLGIADKTGVKAYKNLFAGSRTEIRQAAVQQALKLLKQHIG